MPLFSSTRERWLWLWTLAVVAAIASSLWVGGQLAEALRDLDALEEALSAGLFLLGMLLVGATVVVQGVWARPGRLEIAVAMGIAAVYLLVFLRIAVLEERSHLIEYGVLGVFVYAALAERTSQGRRLPLPPSVLADPGHGGAGPPRRVSPAGRPQSRLRPVGHPLQRAGGGAGGGGVRRAGVGTAARGWGVRG